MIYINTASDVRFMQDFGKTYEQLRKIENAAGEALLSTDEKTLTTKSWPQRVREKAPSIDSGYGDLRTKFAKMVVRAKKLTDAQMVSHNRIIQGSPIGGRPFSGSIYEAVLDPPSSFLDLDTDFRNTLNMTVGALEQKANHEFFQFINPLYWLGQFIRLALRIPHIIIQMSGFDPKKIEDHFLGRIAEFLFIMGVIIVLTKLGIAVSDVISILAHALAK